jgi:predicted transcriptional regulator
MIGTVSMSNDDLLRLSAQIVSAQAEHHNIGVTELPGFIRSVYDTLRTLHTAPAPTEASALTPAVPIKQSVFPGYIVCLEDGQKFKMLKRHLRTAYGMTPEAYRAKWDLPHDYPMTAPEYVTRRSAIAKDIGLGHMKSGGRKAGAAARRKSR